jgi:hypothetical protein
MLREGEIYSREKEKYRDTQKERHSEKEIKRENW